MRKVAKVAFYLILVLLVACGGDTGFVGSDSSTTTGDTVDPTDPTTTVVANLTLLSSNPQLSTGDDSGVTITAIARDSGNLVLADKTVVFSANSGALQVIETVTNDEGIASAKLTTGGDEENRTIRVSALSGDVTSTLDVDVAGTAITVSGQSSMVLTATNTLTLTLKDSFGDGIFDEDLTVTSNFSPTLTDVAVPTNTSTSGTLTVTTDTSGQAQITLQPSSSGTHNVTVAALGATRTFVIAVTNDVFELSMPSNADAEVDLGTNETVQIRYEDNGGAVSGITVNFVTTRGGFGGSSATTAVTNASGIATVSISSQNAGPATIQAFVDNGPSTTVLAEFVATTTDTVEVQTNLSTVSLGGGQATITATVRDADNNLVKNKVVNFSLEDVTGGNLTNATDITDSNGQASTVYESASTASAKDGVVVTATVADGSGVTSDVTLTVGNRALFITLGTGNELFEPNETDYQKPFTVRVADSSGAGVANVQVSLSVIPEKYYKGYYEWSDVAELWGVIYHVDPTTECLNEDRNRNGIFDPTAAIDPDVDQNNDGILWPGTVATVSQSVVTTNDAGEASFTLNYSQQYANFVQVTLEATANVSGTEAINSATFRLQVLADDIKDQAVSPPSLPQVIMWPRNINDLSEGFFADSKHGSPYGVGNPYGTPAANNCNFNEFIDSFTFP